MNLKGRNFLTLKDFTPEEITYMIDLAAELKAKKKAGELHEYYKGKNIALIFEKTSTRTRCAFEVLILIRQDHRSARKKVLPIPQEFSEECMKESNTEDLDRILLKNWPNMQAFRYGTD